ncbi:TIR domain-containing protein [Stenotrophomonas maltophilia]|uniref:TIR domain-containing protein n=1 Tax=Stenotrophomonas maltophilia TaxID=40324 RepID=UPI0013DB9E78|nr:MULTISPECIES: nucleotide-binding protein [Stenotrophomonas]
MARAKIPDRRTANLTAEQMRSGLKKIERRIADLEAFDVNLVERRWDPAIEALEKRVNSTLQDVLGHDTVEYQEYSIGTLDTLPLIMGGGPDPLSKVHAGYREGIKRELFKLGALRDIFQERLEDSGEVSVVAKAAVADRESTRRVFVVHGHDDGLKETVARYLSRLELAPVILHEEPNQGRTIIEKFERHADVDFAVVLFTPDDVGYPANRVEKSRPRPRQNVVLELGFFMGTLGRQRVCVLYSGDVELPSDYAGVLYLPLDAAGAWRFLLAKEMKASGIDIDLNRAG